MAGKSVLIVDDSLIITEHLRVMLSGLNKVGSIECAGDYPIALQLLVNMSFDLVLLDINLRGKNGIDLLRHIKANYPQTIVIMLTNRATPYYRDICQRLGAEYFMDKSSEFEDLLTIISSLP
jgi:DNA-binding NarL/FixJ family response regulator